ncbi:MAG TPA: type 4a pilus biogenesis protein PilO [Rubrobacter sp.]|nr:type 4a pilus biogenesis protein PilO [Rubrobacter sp.]
MSRNDRTLLLLGALGIVLIVVAFYFLLLSPLLGQLDAQAQAEEDKQAQLAQLQQEVNELEEVRRNSPEIERQLLELSKRIPSQPEIPTLVVQIQEIAEASGVTQLSIEPGTPAPPPGGGDYSVVPITMTFKGTYDQMQDFLLRTRNLARLVTVNDVGYCRVPPLDSEHSCPVEVAELAGGESTTTLDPTVEALLVVQIKAEVYFQPTGVTSGESTTVQPAEVTTGG